MDVYSPHYSTENSFISKAILRAWPKHIFNTIEDIDNAKSFYTSAYKELTIEADKIIDLYNPVAWVRIAYMQLEAWSLIHWLDDETKTNIKLEGPEEMAAAGRYGWRYILEKCLEKCQVVEKQYRNSRPSDYHINALFGIIVSLTQVSEISNYLHYLPTYLSSTTVTFSPYIFNSFPELNSEETKIIGNIREYISNKNDYDTYPLLDPQSNGEFKNQVDNYLRTCHTCSMAEIRMLQSAINKICETVNASILVDSYDNFVSLCSDHTRFTQQKVKNILSLLLLNPNDGDYKTRDFLSKSQSKRMLNYCGVIFKLKSNFDMIYDENAFRLSNIQNSLYHILLSPSMMIEWEANFYFRIALGQRPDLKSTSHASRRCLSDIEQYYHKNVFENEVKMIFDRLNFICIQNIKKVNNINLPCGEIDLICYNPIDGSIIVVEAKSSSPTYDARAMGKVISDHYKQKKYHEKFIKKISWVTNNCSLVEEIFQVRGIKGVEIKSVKNGCFITAFPSIMKFLSNEYTVMKYDEITNHFNAL